jgi:protein-disulfide isomerase
MAATFLVRLRQPSLQLWYETNADHMKRILPFIIILLVLGVAVGSAYYLKRSATDVHPVTNTNGVAPTTAPITASTGSVPGAEPAHTLGPTNAPVHLEEFGDFECPPCGLLHPILVQMHGEFGDRLQITFREFPLVPAHQHAIAAASAAEAAGLQGKFWEMHDLLYENQKNWHETFDVRPIFEGYAKQIGIDVERFKQDINSEAVAQRIFQDGKRGHSLNVKGTPTVFMNGREIPFESLPAEKLRVLINAELSSSK